MVLSSLAPLFLLMGIRGNSLLPELYFTMGCLALAILPSMFPVAGLQVGRKLIAATFWYTCLQRSCRSTEKT